VCYPLETFAAGCWGHGGSISSIQSLSKGFKAFQTYSKVSEKKIIFPDLGVLGALVVKIQE
jgi:hypothetical protein